MNRSPELYLGGYVTLMSILITSAVAVVIALSLLALSMGRSLNSNVVYQSSRSDVLTEACVEEAIQNVVDDNNYSGTGTLNINGDNCIYEVVSPILPIEIRATGTVLPLNVQSRFQVFLNQINPSVIIDSWEKVASF